MVKNLTVKKGDLTGAIRVRYLPQFGFGALVKCPDYKGNFQGEETDFIGLRECLKCKNYIGLIHGVECDYVQCKRVRVKKVKAGS